MVEPKHTFAAIETAFAAGRFSEAEALATLAAELCPDDARAYAYAAISALRGKGFSRALVAAIAAAEREPWLLRHWHLVGSALCALGRTADARAIYDRLCTLHPNDARARAAVADLKRGHPSQQTRAWVAQLRAKPKLSACLIVKNEEARVGRCLQSLVGVCDEVVVADTGSTDATKEIVLSHGVRVVDTPWVDDFSAARNAALDVATGDWILTIDADEQLTKESGALLLQTIAQATAGAVSVELDEHLDGGRRYKERMIRVFRRHPLVRYEGRIHEQITPSLARAGFLAIESAVVISHDGYTSEILHETGKLARNECMLAAEIAATPDDPYWRYQLGKNHMMQRSYADAIACFDAAVARLAVDARPPYLLDLQCCLLRLLVATREHERALQLGKEALEAHPTSPDLHFFVGQALLELDRRDEARAAMQRVCDHQGACRDPEILPLAKEAVVALASVVSRRALFANEHVALVVTRRGTFLVDRAGTSVSRTLEANGEFAEAELEALLPLLAPDSLVVDVGASLGVHAVAFARAVGPHGRVLAIERGTLPHRLLCANLALNGVHNVDAVLAAAGDATDVVRLDALELAQCRLVRIGLTEGAAAVLRGSRTLIRTTAPLLFVRNDSLVRSREILTAIAELGYRAYWHLSPATAREASRAGSVRRQPAANLLAVPSGVTIEGLIEAQGMSDDWEQALRRGAK